MSADISDLIPEMQPYAKYIYQYAAESGAAPEITSTLRSRAEQQRLYDLREAGKWPYPVAVPGTSAHEYGFAMDMEIFYNDQRADVARTWQRMGGVYGGRTDPVHFEYPGFKAWLAAQGPTATAQASPRESTGYKAALTIADYILTSVLPGWLAYTFGTAQLASAIYSSLGGDEPALVYYATHPAEYIVWLADNSVALTFTPIGLLLKWLHWLGWF